MNYWLKVAEWKRRPHISDVNFYKNLRSLQKRCSIVLPFHNYAQLSADLLVYFCGCNIRKCEKVKACEYFVKALHNKVHRKTFSMEWCVQKTSEENVCNIYIYEKTMKTVTHISLCRLQPRGPHYDSIWLWSSFSKDRSQNRHGE